MTWQLCLANFAFSDFQYRWHFQGLIIFNISRAVLLTTFLGWAVLPTHLLGWAVLPVRLLNIAVIIKPDLDDRSHQSRFHRSDLHKWNQNWNLLICWFLDWVSFYQILCSIQYLEKSQNRLGILSWNESSFQFLYCVRVLQIFAGTQSKTHKIISCSKFHIYNTILIETWDGVRPLTYIICSWILCAMFGLELIASQLPPVRHKYDQSASTRGQVRPVCFHK